MAYESLGPRQQDEIPGVHILGDAGSLIHEVGGNDRASAEDIGRISHAHRLLPESPREACLAVDKADRQSINQTNGAIGLSRISVLFNIARGGRQGADAA